MHVECVNHPGQPMQGMCPTCRQPYCGQCIVDLGAALRCRPCLTAMVKASTRRSSGFLRLVLSIIPGAGHMYLGLMQRGMHLTLATAVGAVVAGTLFGELAVIVLGIAVMFSIFDAREAHLRQAQGLEVPDLGLVALREQWNPRWTSYALIGAGALLLFNTLLYDLLRFVLPHWRLVEVIKGSTLGLVAIWAGFRLLRAHMGHRQEAP